MLYYAAFAFACLSFSFEMDVDKQRRYLQPKDGRLMHFVAELASLNALFLFIYGFWITWYTPLVGFVFSGLFYIVASFIFRNADFKPGISILSGLMSIVLTIALFV